MIVATLIIAARRTAWCTLRLARLTLMAVATALAAASADAQVLVTGETGGAGAHAVMASANLLSPDDFDTLKNVWVQYGYGAGSRVDVFASYGAISVLGGTQQYAGIGSNINLLRAQEHVFALSLFNNVSIPITRRNESSDVLLNVALVASRQVSAGSITFTPYGGFNTLAPIGHREQGTFTPLETLHTGIVGVSIPLGARSFLFAEVNPGPGITCGGVGVVYVWPK